MDLTLKIFQFLMMFHKLPFLRPLLFLFYINDLRTAIKFSKVNHFADDTNLLYTHNSVKKINNLVNFGLKDLPNFLNASKISQNVSKIKLMFKTRMKKIDFDLKLKLNGKRFYPNKSVKYLGVKIIRALTGISTLMILP